MMRVSGIVCFLLCGPALAEPWIDYERLFESYSDKIITSSDAQGETVRSIDFGDGLRVSCTGPPGKADCVGADTSRKGGMGCMFVFLDEIWRAVRNCDGLATAAERERLEQAYDLVGTYIAANAVPPTGWQDLRVVMDNLSEPWNEARCDRVREEGISEAIEELAAPTTLEALTGAAIESRLPVVNPCL